MSPAPSTGIFDNPLELLEAAEEIAGVGHWTFELATGAIYWSPSVYRLHGMDPGEVEPTFELVCSVFAPEDLEKFQGMVQRAIETGERYAFVMPMTDLRGVKRIIRAQGVPKLGEDGKVAGLLGVVMDITEYARAQEHSRMISDVIETSPQSAILTDPDGRVTWVNQAFTKLTGYQLEEVVGKSPGSFLQGPGTDAETVAKMRRHLERKEAFTCEILNYDRHGDPHWIKLAVSPRWDDDGGHVGFASIQFDITEQREARLELERQKSELELVTFKMARQRRELQDLYDGRQKVLEELEREFARRCELEAELRELAGTDELSGVANRRAFLEQAKAEIARAVRTRHPMAVLMCDIDRFKNVNDTYGHDVGDAVIKATADVCVQATRQDMDLVGRLGGEEFAILLPETGPGAAEAVAQRILRTLRDQVVEAGEAEISVTASIGVAMLRPTGDTVRDLLVRADEALYAAKRDGRDRMHFAEPKAA